MQKMPSNWGHQNYECDHLKLFSIIFIFIQTHFLLVINGFLLLNDENDTERKTNFDNTFLIENKLMPNQHLYEPFPELPKRRSSYLRPMEKINETKSVDRIIFLQGRLNCFMLLQVNRVYVSWYGELDSYWRTSTDNIQFSFHFRDN